MSNLISQFARRIEKYFSQLLTRPKSGPAGTNHIDDPASWAGNEIYKGELILNTEDGAIYTSDGTEIIQLNTEDSIISGLKVRVPTGIGLGSGTPFWLTIESGILRTAGKNYYHTTTEGTGGPPSVGDLQILENNTVNTRIDLIYATRLSSSCWRGICR